MVINLGKKIIIILLIIVLIIIGCVAGIYIFKNTEKQDELLASRNKKYDFNKINNNIIKSENTISVDSKDDKTGVTTKIIKKIYHQACNHLVEEESKIEEEYINLNEEEFKKRYSEWEIQKFTPKEVIIYKEIPDFCDEHYILKDVNGYISIYKSDMLGNETLYLDTDIWIAYLSEQDINDIEKGLKVYTTKELNKLIEDFE